MKDLTGGHVIKLWYRMHYVIEYSVRYAWLRFTFIYTNSAASYKEGRVITLATGF